MQPGRRRLLGLAVDISQPTHGAAAARVARIASTCLAMRGTECRICGEHCEAGAIRFRLESAQIARPHLDAVSCTGCGECTHACPAGAIRLEPVSAP